MSRASVVDDSRIQAQTVARVLHRGGCGADAVAQMASRNLDNRSAVETVPDLGKNPSPTIRAGTIEDEKTLKCPVDQEYGFHPRIHFSAAPSGDEVVEPVRTWNADRKR